MGIIRAPSQCELVSAVVWSHEHTVDWIVRVPDVEPDFIEVNVVVVTGHVGGQHRKEHDWFNGIQCS